MIGHDLISSALLLLALVALQRYLLRFRPKEQVSGKLASGLLFGLMAVIGTFIPAVLASGIRLDPHTIVLSVGAYWGGPLVGVVAAVVSIVFSAIRDGATAAMSLPAIFAVTAVGLIFRHVLKHFDLQPGALALYLFGGIAQAAAVLCQLLLYNRPPTDDLYLAAVLQLLIFPIATTVLGLLLADVDRRLRTLEELQASEIRFRDLANSSGDFFFEQNADGMVTSISERFKEITGLPKERIEGRMLRRLIDFDVEAPGVSDALTAMNERRPFKDVEFPLRLGDGRQLWLRASAVPVVDVNGVFRGFRGAATNITRRVWERNTLAERERRLNALYDNMQEGLAVYQLVRNRMDEFIDYRIIDANPAFEKHTGLSRESAIGRLASLVYGTGQAPQLDMIGRIAKSGQPIQFDTFFQSLGRHLTISAFGLDDDIVVSVFRDVTDSVRAMEKLRASESRFRDIADCSADWFFEQNANGVLTYLSDRFEKVVGFRKEFFLGKNVTEFVDPERTPIETQQALARRSNFRNLEAVIELPDGRKKWIRLSANPMSDADGTFLGYRGTASEITAEKEFQAAIVTERDRARLYLESAGTIMVVLDRDGSIREINRKGQEILGRTREDLIGLNWFDVAIPDNEAERLRAVHAQIVAGDLETAEHDQSEILTKTGETRIVAWTNSVIEENDGHVLASISSGEDITERIEFENALRQSEEHFRKMFETSSDAMVLRSDAAGVFEDANPAALDLYGYTREEFLQLTPMEITAEPEKTVLAIKRLKKDGRLRMDIRLHKKKDGTSFPVELNVWTFGLGGKTKYIAAMRDISDRVAAETALRESETRFRAILEASPSGIFLKDRDRRFLLANPAFCSRIGMPMSDIVGKQTVDLRPPEMAAVLDDHDNSVLETGKQKTIEVTVRERDSKTHTYLTTKYPIIGSDGDISGLACVSTDISGRIRAEAALAESESKFRTIVESVLEGVWEIDVTGKTQFVNDRLLQMFGYERDEMIGRSLTDFVDDDWKENAERNLDRRREGISERTLFKFVRKDGSDLWTTISIAPKLDASGHREAAVALVSDMTQEHQLNTRIRDLESQLSHVSRITQAGELATSFAHQLNQPLAAAGFYAQGLLDQLARGDVAPEEVKTIVAAINDQMLRASEAISRIRNFLRRRKTTKESVSLNEVVRDVVALLRPDLQRFETDIQVRLSARIPMVDGDAVLLQQVLINLTRNAVEAMRETDPRDRKVIVTTSTNRRNEAVLRVRDQGPGLDKKVQEHLFETFFTTKPEGLGMGLAICQTIVESHQGKIHARNYRSGGAVFEVIIPSATGAADGS